MGAGVVLCTAVIMERFGRYVLLERVAHGGMAEVFRAANVGSDGFAKLLAIKRILPHLAADRAFVTMLVDEARISATLNHPNVLQVLDLGRVGSVYFIAMEFVSGQALNHVVAAALRAQFRLPPAFSFFVVSQALRGLAYAHGKTDAAGNPMGIIHRDVSPQNVLVAYDGAVRLADFGIAKAAERSTQTLTGSLKGKPAYMSPEQVQGAPFDQRVDLYAMGVVLHELLAMRRMRRAPTDVQLLMDVAKGDFPRLEDLGINLPSNAAETVYRALAAEPSNRWASATAFADACDDVARAQGWHYSQAQVSQLLSRLFAAEIDKEREAQNRFQALVSDLSHAQSTGEVNQILEKMGGVLPDNPDALVDPTPGSNAAATQVTPPPPEVSAIRAARARAQAPTRVGTQPPAAVLEAPPPPRRTSSAVLLLVGALSVLLVGGGGMLAMRLWSGGAAQGAAQLVISSSPAGARVKLGGRVLEGVTPLVASDVAPGPVEIEVSLPGMLPLKDVVQVAGGSAQKLQFALQPRTASVRVETEPAGASVLVAGRNVCTSPCTVELSGAGSHRVRAELAGHVSASRELAVEDAPEKLDFVLQKRAEKVEKPDPGPPPQTAPRDRDRKGKGKTDKATPEQADAQEEGSLTLQSRPWARLWIDGKDTGRFTPVAEMTLAAGRHTIRLVNVEENLSAQFTVTIKPGETLSLSRELH